ncbi:MAG: MMPL family transporter [Solirubrobacteraceae bacterium]
MIEAWNTSGRTVLFAGTTVCIALLGQFALGVSFLYGLSVSSAIAVALTMATSLTFLPRCSGSSARRSCHAGSAPRSQPTAQWLARPSASGCGGRSSSKLARGRWRSPRWS